MKHNLLIYSIIFLILCFITYAACADQTIITKFSDFSTSKTLEFLKGESQFVNVTIPYDTDIDSAEITLSWEYADDTTRTVSDNILNLLQCDVNHTHENSTYGFSGINTSNTHSSRFEDYITGSGGCGFDATSNLKFTSFNTTQFNNSFNFTVIGWVKTTEDIDNMYIVSRRAGATPGSWFLKYSNAVPKFGLEIFSNESNKALEYNVDIKSSGWVQAGIRINQSDKMLHYSIIFNGSVVAQSSTISDAITANASLWYSRYEGGGNDGWRGDLDEWMFLNYSASDSEIKHLYDLGNNGTAFSIAIPDVANVSLNVNTNHTFDDIVNSSDKTVVLNSSYFSFCANICNFSSGGSCLCPLNFTVNSTGDLLLSELNLVSTIPSSSYTNLSFDKYSDVFVQTEANVFNYTNVKNVSLRNCNVSEGIVEINLRENGYPDFKQMYVYDNDLNTNYIANMMILGNPNVVQWYRLMDVSHSILRGGVINHYQVNNTGTNLTYFLVNRIIVDTEGYAKFWLDSKFYNKFEPIVDGYSLEFPLLNKINASNTKSTADSILMNIFGNKSYPFSSRLPSPIFDKSDDIKGTIIYMPNKEIKYHTQYMETNKTALNRYTFGHDIDEATSTFTYKLLKNEYYVSLGSGTDFDATDTSNITITFYADDNYITDVVLEYKYINFTSTADIGDLSFDKSILNPFLFVGLILVTVICRYIFRSTSGDVGKHVFLIGLIVLTTISTSFLIPAIIAALFYGLSTIKPLLGVQS